MYLKDKAPAGYRVIILMLLLILSWSYDALGQTPNITYSTPQTFSAGTAISPLTPTNTGAAPTINGQTAVFAGSGTAGNQDGTGTGALFNQPLGATTDAQGNIYIADAGNHNIRKITPAGVVTTLAGSGSQGYANGTGPAASFYHPVGLAVDASGTVYVADEENNMIRKISPAGVVTTLAGSTTAGNVNGTGTGASFNFPCGVAVDASGNVYVADYNNNEIRKITSAGVVTTYSGTATAGSANGAVASATFNHPISITIDGSGNLYVADRLNNLIRKIVVSTGTVSTLAGSGTAGHANGTGTAASFTSPSGIACDGTNVFVADEGSQMVREVTPAGLVTTLSGTGTSGATNGPGISATFYQPFGIAADGKSGFVFVGDFNNQVRTVAANPYTISPHLSSGLSFNLGTGIISGTPAAQLSATSYTITAYNGNYADAASLSITIVPAGALNLSENQNYIVTYTPRVSAITTSTALYAASSDKTQVETAVQYIDGLGRPLQTVQAKGSPLGNDLVQPIAYDQFGREATKYLPYTATTNDGSYKASGISDQSTFYHPSGSTSGSQQSNGVINTLSPFSQTVFEPSPLNRVVEQGAPGDAWQPVANSTTGHTEKLVYTTNNTTALTDTANSTTVALYTVTINPDESRTLNRATGTAGNYAAGQLYVTVSKNENWTSGRGGTTEEYKDMEGHVVLKRTFNWTGSVLQILSTYYVYDDLGNLAFVLTPLSGADSATPSQVMLDNLCYQYRYDERNRLVQKKLPGKGWEYMVYNQLDQPVLSQDAVQRVTNQWNVIKYDALGRTVVTGLWNAGSVIPLATLQANIYSAAQWDVRDATNNVTLNPTGYVISSYPTLSTALTINYYDDYTAPGQPSTVVAPTGASTMTSGLITATKTAVLNTPANMLWKVNYYDDLGRVTQAYAQHYLGGVLSPYNYDVVTNTYDFTNEVTASTRKHYNTTNTTTPVVTIANTYVYDHMGRKKQTWEQINGGTNVLLADDEYNETGQLMTKNLHSTNSGSSYLQSIAYAYNERGWLLSSTAPLFALQLQYNTATNKNWNGNIMYQYWGTPGNLNNHYTYSYDNLNRLTNGNSTTLNDNESGIAYDLNGNITALTRSQAGTNIDVLAYTYTTGGNYTNQAQTIADGSGNNAGLNSGTMAYTYDLNGNLQAGSNTVNTSQNKSFTYNLLNLPQAVTVPTGTVTFTYDAGGKKLRKVSVLSGVTNATDYIDGIEYDNSTTTIGFIQTEEGRALNSGGNWHYEYSLTDHLGDERVSFDTYTGAAVTVQADNYYPFGMELSTGTTVSPKNEYLYNKKELQEELSLYDYGARFYDPVIARWTSVDPLAEKMRRFSTYNYGFDNPIKNTDPDGMAPPDEVNYDTQTGERTVLNTIGRDQGVDIVHFGHYETSGPAKGAFAITSTQTFNETPGLDLSAPKLDFGGPHIGPTVFTDPGQTAVNQFNATISAQYGPVNYNDFGSPLTSAAIGSNIVNGFSAVSGGFGIANMAGFGLDAAEATNETISLTKSSFGHTFTTHGEEMTDFLTNRASGSGMAQGQFLDNQAAARFINNNLGQLDNGATNITMPEGFPARVINPDGSFDVPTHIRLVPSGTGVKTAYPLVNP